MKAGTLWDSAIVGAGATGRPVPRDAILTALGVDKDPASGLVTAAGAGSTTAITRTGWLLERELSAAISETGVRVDGR